MRTLLTLLFFSIHFIIQAQAILTIDSIPSKGIVLDKGWKWHEGDKPEWAKPGFKDTDWKIINPIVDIHDSFPELKKAGIGWLRLKLSFDSAITKKQLTLAIQQSVASEIYLDGDLIKTYGTLSNEPGKVKAYNPIFSPLSLPITGKTQLLLAIRIAIQPDITYTTIFATQNPVLFVSINEADKSLPAYVKDRVLLDGYKGFLIGLYLLLILIHFAYFFFQPSQRANLYFGLYAVFMLLFTVVQLVIPLEPIANKFYSLGTGLLITIIANFLLLNAIYLLLDQKKDRTFWMTVAFAVPAYIVSLTIYGWGWHLGADILSILIQLNITRVALIAVRKKKKGSWLMATGAFCCLLFFVLFVATLSFLPDQQMLANILYAISGISIPVTTSIYLGLEFGFVSNSLSQKLKEVNELSQKNIEQEKEKQQILAVQNETLEQQVKERTAALNQSLENLKSTQSQLIQSEKMASLGELTAGIAHEIQNPLNFVNNFSDVNKELLGEMTVEIDKGNYDEVKLIAKDIIDNEQKINNHGKRADSIVKGMLQHSRTGSGQKEPTDINALADEYLRLSYHGLRAKDKAFNAEIKTHFDSNLPLLNIVPQDIGRAILNLFTNAFYSVNQKKALNPPDYQPTVSLSTKKIGNKVEIRVKDNGMGIPQKALDKIFQPFFTTKPTGQGTGLGLSLTYDIVTKGHGGELSVETHGKTETLSAEEAAQAGNEEGAEFIILLPL